MAPADDPDGMLIRSLQTSRDNRLYIALIERYRDYVYNFCFRFLGNEEDAEDCSQEVFIRVFLSIGDFRFKSRFSTWLYRITLNICLEAVRSGKKRGYRIPVEEVMVISTDEPGEMLERKEVEDAFRLALGKLRMVQRAMLIMRDLEGRSYAEISAVTGKRPGTVRSTLARARLKVARELKEYHDEK